MARTVRVYTVGIAEALAAGVEEAFDLRRLVQRRVQREPEHARSHRSRIWRGHAVHEQVPSERLVQGVGELGRRTAVIVEDVRAGARFDEELDAAQVPARRRPVQRRSAIVPILLVVILDVELLEV